MIRIFILKGKPPLKNRQILKKMNGNCTRHSSMVCCCDIIVMYRFRSYNIYLTLLSLSIQHYTAFETIIRLKNCLFQHIYFTFVCTTTNSDDYI